MILTLLAVLPWLVSPEPENDIIETAATAGGFETLLAAVEAAELKAALQGEGPFTVFAPTDEAFAKVPQQVLEDLLKPVNRPKLVQVLAYHVLPTRLDAVSAAQKGTVETLESSTLEVRFVEGRLKVGDALILQNDIETSNGVIHVIDSVLLPPTQTRSPVVNGAIEFIELTIARGVPLFNNGQVVACSSLYEVAAQSLIQREDLPDQSRMILTQTLESLPQIEDPGEAAWALRRALDVAYLEFQGHSTPTSKALVKSSPHQVLFDFSQPEQAGRWVMVNDDVMGGVSRSEMVRSEEGFATFRGMLSLENNGGFCTARSRSTLPDLIGSDGFELEVRGDGRTYKFGAMKSNNAMGVRVWRTEIPTKEGEWTRVRLPYSSLKLSVMGRTPPNAPSIVPEEIRGVSFNIADKIQAPFALEIRSISAYRENEGA